MVEKYHSWLKIFVHIEELPRRDSKFVFFSGQTFISSSEIDTIPCNSSTESNNKRSNFHQV